MRALVQVDATHPALKASVSSVAWTREGAVVVRAGCFCPTVGESGSGKARICAFVDVHTLAQLLARVHDAFVPRLALAVPLTAPLAMAAGVVLVAVSSTACVFVMVPVVTLALGVVGETVYGEPGPVETVTWPSANHSFSWRVPCRLTHRVMTWYTRTLSLTTRSLGGTSRLAAVVIRVPQAAILGIVGDAVVGAALQQPVALPVLVAVALPLRAEVSSLPEVAAVLPPTADSPHRRQLLQRDHHCLACATVFQFSHLLQMSFFVVGNFKSASHLGQLAVSVGRVWQPKKSVANLIPGAQTRALVA